jgi:hypothetical protein
MEIFAIGPIVVERQANGKLAKTVHDVVDGTR